jgi:tetratricopeptide (TPR) repeat protein
MSLTTETTETSMPGAFAAAPAAAATLARAAIEHQEWRAAIGLLEAELAAETTTPPRPGEAQALLAQACFQTEQYERAARQYEAALAAAPERADWREMHALAQANAIAGIDVHVPPLQYFERDALLAPSPVRSGDLPTLRPVVEVSATRQLYRDIGDALGAFATVVVNAVTHLWGWLAGYRDTSGPTGTTARWRWRC